MSLALDDKNHLSCHSVGCFKVKKDDCVFTDATSSLLVDEENPLTNDFVN